MIRTEQLYYLVEVAKYHSITLAAKEMYLTKSAISTAMKQLEKECGFDILERTYRGVSLTPKGERVLEYAKQILAMLEEMTHQPFEESQPLAERKDLYIDKALMPLLQNKLILPSKGIVDQYNIYEVADGIHMRNQLDDKNLLIVVPDNDELAALEADEQNVVKVLFSSRFYPVSSKRTRWIDSTATRITREEYEQLPKVFLGDMNQKYGYRSGTVVLQTENSNVYVNAVLNDLGIGMMTDFAKDVFMENRKLLKVYEPIDDNSAHIVILLHNSGDLTRADLVERALKEYD